MAKSVTKERRGAQSGQDAGAAGRSSGTEMAGRLTLRQARIRRLMSANELGKRAGVAASTVLKIEQGAVPHLATIAKLLNALEMDADEIAWPGNPLGDLQGESRDESRGGLRGGPVYVGYED